MTGGGSSIILSFSPPRLTKQQIIMYIKFKFRYFKQSR
jgi:hypothetical protein